MDTSLPITMESIVVGVDVHKYCHTAVAMNVLGSELGMLDFDNQTLEKCTDWLNTLGEKTKVIVGLEDVNGYGVHLTDKLYREGFQLRYVPAILTKRERKHSTHQEKSDYTDAKRVGKVILNNIEETLPATPIIHEKDKVLRLIDAHLHEREILVHSQTAVKNQMHSFLHQYYGDTYKGKFKDIFSYKALGFYRGDIEGRLNGISQTKVPDPIFLGRALIRLIDHLKVIKSHMEQIDATVEGLTKTLPEIKALSDHLFGCSWLTASKIMSEIKYIGRFDSEAQLAQYGGFAPTKFESAGKGRLHTTRRGNRALNCAVQIIALSQIGRRGPEYSKTYYKKKLKEGKSKLWGIRCLKRQIIRRIYSILKNSQRQTENSSSH